MSTTRVLFLFLSIIVTVSAVATAARLGRKADAIVGGYSPIPDLKDEHVVEIAKYAVETHNTKEGTHLKYVKVVKGQQQVVAGTNYLLDIAAEDGSTNYKKNKPRTYEALVYERPWQHYRNLTYFKSV